MLVVVTRSRRLLPFLVALLLTTVFAGCVGSEDPVDTAGTPEVHPGCEEADLATIGSDGSIRLDNDTVRQPLTLCITNEDDKAHSWQAMPSKPPKPDFVPLPTVVDPHAEHRGGAAPVVGPVTIEAGATAVVTDIAFHGILMFMEVGNMSNSLVWEILPAEAATYPVIENQVVMSGTGSGDTDAGDVGTHSFEVSVPDLAQVQLNLRWDDSEDDGEGGQAANQADTLELRLKDASGTEVAKKSLKSRSGEIRIDHGLDVLSFPEEITAQGMTNATAALAVERPPDLGQSGTWTVEVAVLAAPGTAPDEDGSTKGLPTGDGHQSWSLEVITVHRWASVGFVGAETSPDIVQAAL